MPDGRCSPTILPLQPGHVRAVCDLYESTAWFHYGLDTDYYSVPSVQEFAAIRHSMESICANRSDAGAFVALLDEEVVGFVCFETEEEGYLDTNYNGLLGLITELYTSEMARGRGVGAMLLRHAEEALIHRGCVAFKLQVATQNSAAIQFYQRCGWNAPQQHLMFKRSAGTGCGPRNELRRTQTSEISRSLCASPMPLVGQSAAVFSLGVVVGAITASLVACARVRTVQATR